MINLFRNRIFKYLGLDVLEELTGELEAQREELSHLRTIVYSDERNRELVWLLKNKEERMDASLSVFDEGRRQFHLARYEFAAAFASGKKVADVACGTGYGTEILALRGQAESVVGIDISPESIEYATKRHACSSITYQASPAESTELTSSSFDLIVSFETIEHVSDDMALLSEFNRLLTPGGLFVCSVPNQWPLEETPHHVREYDYPSLLALLSQFFSIEAIYNQNSGSHLSFNRGQPAGIVESSAENRSLAECYLAVCRKPA